MASKTMRLLKINP